MAGLCEGTRVGAVPYEDRAFAAIRAQLPALVPGPDPKDRVDDIVAVNGTADVAGDALREAQRRLSEGEEEDEGLLDA